MIETIDSLIIGALDRRTERVERRLEARDV